MIRRIVLSLMVGLGAAALVIVADFAVVAYWQPRWLVECVAETAPQPTVAAPTSDPQASVSEAFVSGSVCTDRYGVPVTLAVGALVGALCYWTLKRSR
jgi:hypothetical protein